MSDRKMKGIFPILAMPFDEHGLIDFDDLRQEVEWAIGHGVHGLGVAVASEIFKLSESERNEVTKVVVEQANGRVKIVINTGEQGTDLAIRYSKQAEELGADALMIRPPTLIPVPDDDIAEYFLRIALAVNIPIFMQDQSNGQVSPGLAVRCSKLHENLCYIKIESPPTVPRVAQAATLKGDSGLVLFGGAGGQFLLEEFRRGSVGSMPGCAIPDVFVRLWDMWQNCEEADAEVEFHRYATLLRTLSQGLGWVGWIYKEILVQRGVFKQSSAYDRHPGLKPDQAAVQELQFILDELGLRK